MSLSSPQTPHWLAWALLAIPLLLTAGCERDSEAAMLERVQQAMDSEDRPDGDRQRDAGRKPLGMAQFFGLRQGMTVLDLSSGGGYNLDLFAAAVGEAGKVYAHNTEFGLTFAEGRNRKAIEARLANNRLPNVVMWNREMDNLGLEGEVDLAYSGLNLHDYWQVAGEEGTIEILKAIRRTLKPDGQLGITDHRGEAGRDNIALHRIEQDLAFRLIEAAGFEIIDSSELLSNPNDDFSKFVFDPAVFGKTDRFLILVR